MLTTGKNNDDDDTTGDYHQSSLLFGTSMSISEEGIIPAVTATTMTHLNIEDDNCYPNETCSFGSGGSDQSRAKKMTKTKSIVSASSQCYSNFILFSICFTTNHSAGLATLALATARLDATGAWQTGILYLTYTASAVMGATLVVERLGSKKAVCLGMYLFCVYVGCFLAATLLQQPTQTTTTNSFNAATALAWIGAGICWTGQGVYYSQASKEYAMALQRIHHCRHDENKSWSWSLLILVYSLEGSGRATFEGTLKAIFADYFPLDHEKEGAFANIILQYGLASSLGYALSFRLSCPSISKDKYCIEYTDGSYHNNWNFGLLVVISSLLAIVGYIRASCIYQSETKMQQNTDDKQVLSILNIHDTSSK